MTRHVWNVAEVADAAGPSADRGRRLRLSLSTGWGVTLVAAELWIRYTRGHSGTPILSVAPRRPSMFEQGGTE